MDSLSALKLPSVFDIPIMDYFDYKVFCKGLFRYPTDQERKRNGLTSDKELFAVFEPAEPHGWKMYFYSIYEVFEIISKARVI